MAAQAQKKQRTTRLPRKRAAPVTTVPAESSSTDSSSTSSFFDSSSSEDDSSEEEEEPDEGFASDAASVPPLPPSTSPLKYTDTDTDTDADADDESEEVPTLSRSTCQALPEPVFNRTLVWHKHLQPAEPVVSAVPQNADWMAAFTGQGLRGPKRPMITMVDEAGNEIEEELPWTPMFESAVSRVVSPVTTTKGGEDEDCQQSDADVEAEADASEAPIRVIMRPPPAVIRKIPCTLDDFLVTSVSAFTRVPKRDTEGPAAKRLCV